MKCPGQDSRFWKADAIFEVRCPNCGTTIEFFKDDTRRRCPGCGEQVPNPEMDFGCAAYCPYAEHCLGSLPEGVTGDSKLKVLKGKMFKEIKQKLPDSKKVALSVRFLELCEELGKKEGVKLGPVLLCAFVLSIFDILTENKTTTISDKSLLEKTFSNLGAEKEVIEEAFELLKLIEYGGKTERNEVKVILDAKKIAILESDSKSKQEILNELMTDSGKQIVTTKIFG